MSIEKLILKSNKARKNQLAGNKNQGIFLGLFTLGALASFAIWLVYNALMVSENVTVPSPWH